MNLHDEQNRSGVGHREGVKACELTEADSQVVQKKRASKGNTVDDSQLIADEEEEQSDDIGRGEVTSGKKRMKLFATRPATAGVAWVQGRERELKKKIFTKRKRKRKRGNTSQPRRAKDDPANRQDEIMSVEGGNQP
jgi:hypothetical protein